MVKCLDVEVANVIGSILARCMRWTATHDCLETHVIDCCHVSIAVNAIVAQTGHFEFLDEFLYLLDKLLTGIDLVDCLDAQVGGDAGKIVTCRHLHIVEAHLEQHGVGHAVRHMNLAPMGRLMP